MNDFARFGVTAADSAFGKACSNGAPRVFPSVTSRIAEMTARHIAPAAHAVWAVKPIAPQRKRPTAVKTDASVNRGLI
jgi:hypothetical protein